MKPLQNWNVYPDFSKETGVLFSFFSSSRFRPTCSNKKHDLLRAAVEQRTKKKQMGLLKQDEKGRIYDVDGSRILHQLRLEVSPSIFDGFCLYQVVSRILSINDSHFQKACMPFQQSRFSRNESLQDKRILLRYHSRFQWFTVRKCRGFAIGNDSNAYYVFLALSPLPGCQSPPGFLHF